MHLQCEGRKKLKALLDVQRHTKSTKRDGEAEMYKIERWQSIESQSTKEQRHRLCERKRGRGDHRTSMGMPVRDFEALGSIDPITTTSTSDSG